MLGAALGGGLGQGVGEQLGLQAEARRLNPMREALLEQLSSQEGSLTPQQQLLLTAAQDPTQFAMMARDPQQMAMISQLAAPAKKEPSVFSRVVSGDDPLNQRFGLGIPPGKQARVEFTRQPDGLIEASVQGAFGGSGTTINLDPGGTTFERELGKLNVEDVKTVRESAEQARSRQGALLQARVALEKGAFTPGAFGDTRAFLARVGDLVGVDLGLGDAASAEELQAASDQLALAAAERLSRATNMSLGLARNTVTGLNRTPEGNKAVLNMLEREAQLQIEEAEFVNEFVAKHPQGVDEETGKTLAVARMEWRRDNPVVTPEMLTEMEKLAESDAPSIQELLGEGRERIKLIQHAGEVDRMDTAELADYAASITQEEFDQLPLPVRRRILERLQDTSQ